jgi:hypothetical protein
MRSPRAAEALAILIFLPRQVPPSIIFVIKPLQRKGEHRQGVAAAAFFDIH